MSIFDQFRLDGKVAVVTGGYGLYGAHICRALAEAGALVVVASRNVEKCCESARSLKAKGYEAAGMRVDLSDEESIRSFVNNVISSHGAIDILVNNAVLREGMADLEDITVEGWEQAQKVNSTGTMVITREVIKNMKARGKGNIINISSIRGVDCPHFPVYGSTGMSSPVNYTYDKWGMIGFTKWVAGYYGKYGIRCNAISPGGYSPVFGDQPDNEFIRNYVRMTPLGRFADDDDIKGAIIYLASDASSYVTGHN